MLTVDRTNGVPARPCGDDGRGATGTLSDPSDAGGTRRMARLAPKPKEKTGISLESQRQLAPPRAPLYHACPSRWSAPTRSTQAWSVHVDLTREML